MPERRWLTVQNTMKSVVVPQEYDGSRLDKALELLAPEYGARQRKRLLLSGTVYVDGRRRPKGYLVRAGQEITLESPAVFHSDNANDSFPQIIARTDLYAAVLKQGGRHSQSLQAHGGTGVDACLPSLFPNQQAILLNRLDYLTSGLLLVGFSSEAEQLYHRLQDAGEVRKQYFALVEGRLERGFVAREALDSARRRKVKVLSQEAEPLRHSEVSPVMSERFDLEGSAAWRTLLHVRILKGARHQIRAHLAAAGHAVVGDPLYGRQADSSLMYLHHSAIDFKNFSAQCRPDWPALPEQFLGSLRRFPL